MQLSKKTEQHTSFRVTGTEVNSIKEAMPFNDMRFDSRLNS